MHLVISISYGLGFKVLGLELKGLRFGIWRPRHVCGVGSRVYALIFSKIWPVSAMTVHAVGGIDPRHVRPVLASRPDGREWCVVRVVVFLGEALSVFVSIDELECCRGVSMHELVRPLIKQKRSRQTGRGQRLVFQLNCI